MALPHDFNPRDFDRGRLVEQRPREDIPEGVTLLHEDAETGVAVYAVNEGGEIRCWHCYPRPDGSKDCFQIPCPWDEFGPIESRVMG
jgi:hypothetical protein